MCIRKLHRKQLHMSDRLSEQNNIKLSVEYLMLPDSVGKTRYAIGGVNTMCLSQLLILGTKYLTSIETFFQFTCQTK